MTERVSVKVPILYYNEPEDGSAAAGVDLFPYIEVQQNEEFPKALFIQEWRETGEFELTNEGKMPIVERDIKLFINSDVIKDSLSEEQYVAIRAAAGLPVKKGNRK